MTEQTDRSKQQKKQTEIDTSASTTAKQSLTLAVPQHVAIIMDGNGRWARAKGLPRVEGHRAGMKSVRLVVERARELGVKYLTLFCFSTENWQRPENEVSSLMSLFSYYLQHELDNLLKNGVRLRAIGDIESLSPKIVSALRAAEERTVDHNSMQLIVAVSYGGREEILSALKKLVLDYQGQDKLQQLEKLDQDIFRRYLYAPDVPDPDLLIRTSAEFRISNFLLWQLAYSEIVVVNELWPDFGAKQLDSCIAEYARRERRFGMTAEQLAMQTDGRGCTLRTLDQLGTADQTLNEVLTLNEIVSID